MELTGRTFCPSSILAIAARYLRAADPAVVDRQVIISYLEGIEAASISEITGLSPEKVAMWSSGYWRTS